MTAETDMAIDDFERARRFWKMAFEASEYFGVDYEVFARLATATRSQAVDSCYKAQDALRLLEGRNTSIELQTITDLLTLLGEKP